MQKQFPFQTIQFSISTRFKYQNSCFSNISTQLIIFDSDIGPHQVLPLPARVDVGAMKNKGVLRILQSANMTGISPSNCLVSYLGHSFV